MEKEQHFTDPAAKTNKPKEKNPIEAKNLSYSYANILCSNKCNQKNLPSFLFCCLFLSFISSQLFFHSRVNHLQKKINNQIKIFTLYFPWTPLGRPWTPLFFPLATTSLGAAGFFFALDFAINLTIFLALE